MAIQLKYALCFLLLSFFVAPAASASAIGRPGNNLGLVGYWSFNEGTSTTAHDFSGNGYKGTLSGSTKPSWTGGKLSKGLSFDGSTSYVDIGNLSALSFPSSDFSICSWVYPTSNTGYREIINKGDTVSAATSQYELLSSSVGDQKFRFDVFKAGANDPVIDTDTHLTNQWYYVCGVRQGSSDYIYVDGVQKNSASYAGPLNTPAYGVAIGAAGSGSGLLPYAGVIDEVRIYNRALTDTEVAALYQAGSVRLSSSVSPGTLSSGLVGWWTMDGADTNWTSATAGVEYDRSGNGNTGTLTAMNRATSTMLGKVGQALRFTTAPTYIVIGDATSLKPTQISVAAWVNPSSMPDWATVLMKSTDSSWADGYGIAHYQSSNDIHFFINNYNTNKASGTLSLNTWSYVVGTYDGANINLYINGVLVDSPAYSSAISNSANNLFIGDGTGTGPYPWVGGLDDVRIYNRTLSAGEVKQLYNLGTGTHSNASSQTLQAGSSLAGGLTGLWTFDGSSLNWATGQASDGSGSGNTGQLINMSTTTSPTIGKLGQALNFNGSSQSVTTSHLLTTFCSVSTCTLSAWLYPTGTAASAAQTYNGQGALADSGGYIGIYRDNLSGTDNIWAYNWDGAEEHVGVPYTPNTWIHVVLVHAGGVLSVYKNGAFINSVASGDNTGGGNIQIGKGYDTSGVYWSGKIDDARVYNRALTASEIQQLYNMGK